MNWIHVIAGGIWIYCVLFAGAFFIASNTHGRRRTRRVKKCGNQHWRKNSRRMYTGAGLSLDE
ncbi:MAG TPA: hypothetical protein VIH58_00645 [Chthoniobacterales bacterium]|jgi:hypothetical protein